jgi:serine/threonine protein kinase
MSSQPRSEPNGSQSRHPVPLPTPAGSSVERRAKTQQVRTEDILAAAGPPTDDTPTIISRYSPAAVPALTLDGDPGGIRGRSLAHFELIEPIGVGGMAAVLRARDTQLDRFVALKILPPEMAIDPENVRRFHQEARSAAKLDHENIARVFFCGEDQRLHFIAFEFVEGENLRALLERRGRLPVSEALHYMLQVAAGLAHAAQRGVVHRDIKPSNIIITPSGRAKLVDMGLARSLDKSAQGQDLTQSGVTLGTFDYISPEQALEPRDADVRSDIYSLGCTFYHVLTGRPPVPEGTAARKLHAHQHVKPVDPRQYVPDLPLEVVLILDRMMAKNPRDRFQTPEELVHRLLLAAHKLGINPEVPEGVLAFEAAVPASPAARPLLWIAVAAVAVVLLVLFLDPMTSSPSSSTQSSPGRTEKDTTPAAVKDSAPVAGGNSEDRSLAKPVNPTPADHVYTAPEPPSVEHLVSWLEAHRDASHIELRLAGELDLSGRANSTSACLLVQAKQQVTIRPRDQGARPTIRLRYDAVSTKEVVALTIIAQHSLIEDVRFLVDGCDAPQTEMAALHLRGGKHEVRRCEFIQVGAAIKRLASVVAHGTRSTHSEVDLSQCVFLGSRALAKTEDREGKDEMALSGLALGGQDAVVRNGNVRITADSCAFGPHVAAFRLVDGDNSDDARIRLQHCSILLPGKASAVFELPLRGKGKIEVSHSLFSRLGLKSERDSEGSVLIRQAIDEPADLTYVGRDNCYHDLDGYWCVGDAWQKAGWGDFRLRCKTSSQDSSRVVLTWPWVAEPPALVKMLETRNSSAAFQLNPKCAALRKPGDSGVQMVGVRALLGEPLLPRDTRLPEPDDKAPRFLLVEQKADDGDNLIYKSLEAAVRDARPGDTILIRHNDELPIDPIALNKKTLGDLTIRPARGYRPVLTLGETAEAETALFRLQDGKLRLEGLEFRLRPATKRPFRKLVLVSLAGDGLCVLRDCLVTLERPGEVTVAVASLESAGQGMKLDMPPARDRDDGPRLLLDNCFIRGDGDLLVGKSGRPGEVELKNSLAALSGSLVNIEVPADAAIPPAAHQVRLKLASTTTYLGGHLVRLACGKDPRGLAPLKARADKCLFVAASAGRPLIFLEGADTEERQLKDKFSWDGGLNAYGGYTSLLSQNPGSEDSVMPPPPVDAAKWKNNPGEDRSVFGVKLGGTLGTETRFTQLTPGLFKPSREAPECGVDPNKLPRLGR